MKGIESDFVGQVLEGVYRIVVVSVLIGFCLLLLYVTEQDFHRQQAKKLCFNLGVKQYDHCLQRPETRFAEQCSARREAVVKKCLSWQ